MDFSQEELRKILGYKPDTGKLYWLERPREMFRSDQNWKRWNSIFSGAEAGWTAKRGYVDVRIGKKIYKSHRLIWIMELGNIPEGFQIDHINGVRTDNRIANLRLVTSQENSRNQRRPVNNKTGVVGVYWHKGQKRWLASIGVNYKVRHLGSFVCLGKAIKVRKAAENANCFHQNHGSNL
jgi:hypothetical protein